MLVSELLNKYNFHDSNVVELLHDQQDLIFKLDFCNWEQKDYVEGDEDIKEMYLKFKNIKNFVWDSPKTERDIDYDTILDITYINRNVKIILEDEDISIVKFTCDSVEAYDSTVRL